MVNVTELHPKIGARVTIPEGASLHSNGVLPAILETLDESSLVSIRGLRPSPDVQIELASQLGSPVPFVQQRYRHPDHEAIMISTNKRAKEKPLGVARVGNFWHQDSSYLENPAEFTVLHGVEVPSESGHTLFAHAADVYDRLPDEWKAKVSGRSAYHTVTKRQRIQEKHTGLSIAEFIESVRLDYPDVRHPLVKVDRATGRKYIYGAPEYMSHVEGFDANENTAFFDLLDRLITDEDNVLTYTWQHNDVLVWKTQTTYHAATEVQNGVDRLVHRVSVRSALGDGA